MVVTVPPPWDSLLSLSSPTPASESSVDSSAPSLEELVLPKEQRVSKEGGISVFGWPRVDARTSLTAVLVTTGKMVETTADNTAPEQEATPAVVTETVAAEVVPG